MPTDDVIGFNGFIEGLRLHKHGGTGFSRVSILMVFLSGFKQSGIGHSQ